MMRCSLLQALLPGAVAIMMSLGIVMAYAAQPDSSGATAVATSLAVEAPDGATEPLLPRWSIRESLVRPAAPRADTPAVLGGSSTASLEHQGLNALCQRVADATRPPAPLVERCCEALAEPASEAAVPEAAAAAMAPPARRNGSNA